MRPKKKLVLSHLVAGNFLIFIIIFIVKENEILPLKLFLIHHFILSIILFIGGSIASYVSLKPLIYTIISILISGLIYPILYFSVLSTNTLRFGEMFGILKLSAFVLLTLTPLLICGGVLQYFIIKFLKKK